jgi:hypothetical protein
MSWFRPHSGRCSDRQNQRPARKTWRPAPLALLATLPFALLANSSRVYLATTVERDGSLRRQITVNASPYFDRQVPKWVADVNAGGKWDLQWGKKTGTTYEHTRDFRLPTLRETGESVNLVIQDVISDPLSLYTTYNWTEEINFDYLYESDPAAAKAAGSKLIYYLTMPGQITEASVQPGGSGLAQYEGSLATFTLGADAANYTVNATSQNLRWGYLLIVVYVVSFAVYQLTKNIRRLVAHKPRKI